jgi:hypothetical protein
MRLTSWTVLYRDQTLPPLAAPLAFICKAESGVHAEEQCRDAEPGCEVVWTCATGDRDEALKIYWNAGE